MEDAEEGDGGCAPGDEGYEEEAQGVRCRGAMCFGAGVPGGSAQVPVVVVGLVLLLKTHSLVNSGADFSGSRSCGGVAEEKGLGPDLCPGPMVCVVDAGALLVLDPVDGGGVLCRWLPGLPVSGGCPGLGLSAPSASLLQGVALLLFSSLLLVQVCHLDYSLGGTCAALRYHP